MENKFNSTTQQFITAKISGFALKQGSKRHSLLSQRNLQLQTEAALIFCRIRAVEHRVCGWTSWRTPRFARSNLAKLHKSWECA